MELQTATLQLTRNEKNHHLIVVDRVTQITGSSIFYGHSKIHYKVHVLKEKFSKMYGDINDSNYIK